MNESTASRGVATDQDTSGSSVSDSARGPTVDDTAIGSAASANDTANRNHPRAVRVCSGRSTRGLARSADAPGWVPPMLATAGGYVASGCDGRGSSPSNRSKNESIALR